MTPAAGLSIGGALMRKRKLTANELVEEGRRLRQRGNFITFLHPSQEWTAVLFQAPFLRIGSLLEDA